MSDLTSLIITTKAGYFMQDATTRDPDMVDWVLQGILPEDVRRILADFSEIMYLSDQKIISFLRARKFEPNPIWQSEYPVNFTWYDEVSGHLAEKCTLPSENFISGEEEKVNPDREFEILSRFVSDLDDYINQNG